MKHIVTALMASVLSIVVSCSSSQSPTTEIGEVKPIPWGEPVNGLSCAITSFESRIVVGVPFEIELTIKNVSTNDLLVPMVKGNLYATAILTRRDKQYAEMRSLPKSAPLPPMTRNDFILLSKNGECSFHHKVIAAPKGFPPIVMVPSAGEYQIRLQCHTWPRRISKDADLGGLAPWTGRLISAPVNIRINNASRQEDT